MSRRTSVFVILAIAAASIPASIGCTIPVEVQAPEHNLYNVLFIAVDDLRPELGCYGVADAVSPNIDRIAARGFLFDRHYVQAPTCGAARYSMLTGRSPASTGARSGNDAFRKPTTAIRPETLAGAQSLPELFRRSGYRTVGLGKISHTPDGRLFAYDGSGDGKPEMPHAWDELPTPYGRWSYGWGAFFAYAGGRHREDGKGHRDLMEFSAKEDRALPDGLIADTAVEKLRELAKRDERFFLSVGFYKPHLPHVAPQRDFDAFEGVSIASPSLPDKPQTTKYWHRSGEYYKYDFPFEKSRPLAEADRVTARRAYLACVRYVDRQIGKVLDALEEADLADDTIIVVWGDHGWHLGEQQIWGKHSPFERSARSAFIVRVPGMTDAGARTSALAESLDLFPTLVDLCRPRFDRTEHPLDGVSLAPILRGEDDAVRETAVTYNGNVTSIRTPTHRLIYRAKEGEPARDIELYDLTRVEDSSTDVAAAQPGVVARILQKLAPR